jgi:hypothetical protein
MNKNTIVIILDHAIMIRIVEDRWFVYGVFVRMLDHKGWTDEIICEANAAALHKVKLIDRIGDWNQYVTRGCNHEGNVTWKLFQQCRNGVLVIPF